MSAASGVDRSVNLTVSKPKTPKRKAGQKRPWVALIWLAPGIILIFGVVLFPAGYMIYNSTRKISKAGVDQGPAGFDNYALLFERTPVLQVLARTMLWVVAVVVGTILISLILANFLNKAFPGRRLLRLIVIIPWASSVLMTTMVIYFTVQPNYGLVNDWLARASKYIGFLAPFSKGDFGFTKTPGPAFTIAILIAIFVSLPFTTYTILAGTQSIGQDVLEAAKVDGAGSVRNYFMVVLPQLRPALAAATIINIINVFNSFPILKVITGSIPGYDADTTTTMMFKILQTNQRIDVASALSVLNLGIVIAIIAVYMLVVKPLRGVDE
ncbi:MAG: sugar ABC transporter permease [Micrococcales bacterium]|nr:sugar ABC transporter permease [Micrococcales bacterium]